MGKVLSWVAIGLLIWLGWRLVQLSRRKSDAARAARDAAGPAAPGASAAGAPRPDTPELMMQCAVCGVHLPGSEARFAGGRVYCSDAHREQGADAAAADPSRRDGR